MSATVSMENVFEYAQAVYPHSGKDEPEENDGNTSTGFYMARENAIFLFFYN